MWGRKATTTNEMGQKMNKYGRSNANRCIDCIYGYAFNKEKPDAPHCVKFHGGEIEGWEVEEVGVHGLGKTIWVKNCPRFVSDVPIKSPKEMPVVWQMFGKTLKELTAFEFGQYNYFLQKRREERKLAERRVDGTDN